MDRLGASFRDPAGFLFRDPAGTLLRQINQAGAEDYALLMQSGLYDQLTRQGQLIPHREVTAKRKPPRAHAIIQPEPVRFISYPFEWSFPQLRDAALLTLDIQRQSLELGLSLKDASAYNVQFHQGRPVFIDTLSFEAYKPAKPWQAYGQFCRHFLAPLVLMSYRDQRLSQLSRQFIDGVPLDLAVKLLPRSARLQPATLMHLTMHARAQQAKAGDHRPIQRPMPLRNQLALLDSLERAIRKLQAKQQATEWANYYQTTNYSDKATDAKAKLVKQLVKRAHPKSAIDLGGNTGRYSRLLSDQGINTVCADIDPNVVAANYQQVRQLQETHLLPLLIDLTNPGGALGWANDERQTIDQRLPADIAMALALIHHLAIANNLPLQHIAAYFSRFAPWLLIEWVPKPDSQVQKLLATRKDIFVDYHQAGFEQAFGQFYQLEDKVDIPGTKRVLYLYKRLDSQ